MSNQERCFPFDIYAHYPTSFMKPETACFWICLLIFLCWSCGSSETKSELLAKRHCSSCHLFPDPTLLDKQTWKSDVFPEMAFRMGLDLSRLRKIDPVEHLEVLQTISEQSITEKEWKRIQDYYTSHAPDSLLIPFENKAARLSQFTADIVRLPVQHKTVATLIKHDSRNGKIYVGTRVGKLYTLDSAFVLRDSFQLSSAPSDIILNGKKSPMLSCMGIMDPNDQAAGSVIQLSAPGVAHHILIDSLKRPVNMQQADLNNDGQADLVVSAFGNFTGGLYVYEKKGNQYLPHPIHKFPGNRKTIIRDFNKDGLPDIMTLITQGDEQIALFTNRGGFRFSIRVLLKFPPVYGSSHFEVYDFNNDKHPDILYTNGDNADYSPVLKPFHGVRIFLNDGENKFTQSWFYRMHGASMAHAEDFDQDGDPDIAAISFFPDFKNRPEQSFVYFENQEGEFIPHTTEIAASARWITMEASDIDNDHDTDLMLGALTFPNGVPDSLFRAWKQNPASLMVLRNNLHRE